MENILPIETLSVEIEYVFRFVLAAICGSLIGLERERRAKNAGIRTHVLVAISSALMMVVSKYGFFDVLSYSSVSVDASRIAAGVVSAIGFLGVGVIFVKKENAVGVTTAAGLWATVGMGITIGAGLYFTGIAFTLFILIFQWIFHNKHLHLYSQNICLVTIDLDKRLLSSGGLEAALKKENLSVRSIAVSKKADGAFLLKARVSFPKELPFEEMLEKLAVLGDLQSIELMPVL